MTHNTKHSVLISCILLTGVLTCLVRYLKKVSFHVQEERSVYVVTVLEAQLKTCALAVTLPHVSLVPNKYKRNTHWIIFSKLRPQTVRAVTSNNNFYKGVNRQNETADCASRSHVFIYKHKTHTTPYFLYGDTSTFTVGPHLSAPDWTMDMSIVEASAVELLLLVVKQACVDFLSLLLCSTTNAGKPSSLLHNRPASPFMLVTHGLTTEKPQYFGAGSEWDKDNIPASSTSHMEHWCRRNQHAPVAGRTTPSADQYFWPGADFNTRERRGWLWWEG